MTRDVRRGVITHGNQTLWSGILARVIHRIVTAADGRIESVAPARTSSTIVGLIVFKSIVMGTRGPMFHAL